MECFDNFCTQPLLQMIDYQTERQDTLKKLKPSIVEEVKEEEETRQKLVDKIIEEKEKLKRNFLLEDYLRKLKIASEERK